MSASGQCMCAGVAFLIDGPLRDVWNCHCHRCRRFSGHHVAATAAAFSDVSFSSSTGLTWYSPDGTVEYGFCATCGSSLFWRPIDGERVSICAGTLNPPTGLSTTRAWWVADASDYHTRPVGLDEFDHDG